MAISANASFVGMGLRTYFSLQHLQAAAYFSSQAKELEARQLEEIPKFQVVGYATASLLSSAAFLEALANELFADAQEEGGGHLGALDGAARGMIATYGTFSSVQRASAKGKFDVMLQAAGKSPVSGSTIDESVKLLFDLRNELVHYKAAFFDEGTDGYVRQGAFVDHKLSRQIGGRFHPRAGNTAGGADGWLGAGCAHWGVKSALEFADEVFERLGVEPIYGHVRPVT
ncbi:hypothetical protein ABIE09_001824 [Lysobacter enzymogenes]|uniref:hypothetical protein n=1 Tax=Lysobacter enzymogenes TaxID=69 RepID=UPI00339A3D89